MPFHILHQKRRNQIKSGQGEHAPKIKVLKKKSSTLEMPGIEPGAFHMQSERATTALHPLPCATIFSMLDLKNFLYMTDGRISLWTKS